MEHADRWIFEKTLGRGGQGEVSLVRKKPAGEFQLLNDLFKAWPEAERHLRLDQRQEARSLAANLLSQLIGNRLTVVFGALKVLHKEHDARDPMRARERASREIELMQKWKHPSLLALLDFDLDNLWYVSEYHHKGTLDSCRPHFTGNLSRVLRAIRPLVEGVGLLHQHGVVHRDIKPPNIFIGESNQLVLGDFGLVYVSDPDHTRLSAAHSNVGTHAWMPGWAMEQRVDEIKPTFDVFSLGKVIWSMITGRPVLPLWYHRRDDNNIEKLFPNDSEMEIANRLLDQCVVEHEKDCLPNGEALLDAIDIALADTFRLSPLSVLSQNVCNVCGIGKYCEFRRDTFSGVANYVCDCCGYTLQFCHPPTDFATISQQEPTDDGVKLRPELEPIDTELDRIVEEFPEVWSFEVDNGDRNSTTARDLLQGYYNRLQKLLNSNTAVLSRDSITALDDAKRFLEDVRAAHNQGNSDRGDDFVEKLRRVRRRLRIHSKFDPAPIIPPPPK